MAAMEPNWRSLSRKHPVEVDRKLVKLRAHSSEVEPPHDLAVAIGSPTAN